MKIEFDTDNAAFEDAPTSECCHILNKIAESISYGETSGAIMDFNGNKIGSWEQ